MYKLLQKNLILKKFENDKDVLRKYMNDFVSEIEVVHTQLVKDMKLENLESVSFLAHKLKGLISPFEVNIFYEFLKDMSSKVSLEFQQGEKEAYLKKYNYLYNEILTDVKLFLKLEFPEKNLLLVDDNQSYLNMQSDLFTKRSFTVSKLSSADKILDTIQTRSISLVLLDIMMPGKDGFEALREIRSQYNIDQVAVIMLTSADDEKSILKSYELGANDFIHKNASLEVIIKRLEIHFKLISYKKSLKDYIFKEKNINNVKELCDSLRSPLMLMGLSLDDIDESLHPKIASMKNTYNELETVLDKLARVEV